MYESHDFGELTWVAKLSTRGTTQFYRPATLFATIYMVAETPFFLCAAIIASREQREGYTNITYKQSAGILM